MFSHGINDSRGVLIASREGLHFTVEKEMKDSEGRILMLKIISKTPNIYRLIVINQILSRNKLIH